MGKRAKKAAKQAVAFHAAVPDHRRHDVALQAALELEIIADALITHSRAARRGEFEDVTEVAAIVTAVAQRQTTLASILVRAIDDAAYSTADLETELHNA